MSARLRSRPIATSFGEARQSAKGAAAAGAAFVLLLASPAHAADRFALVITGASGGPIYAEKYEKWRTSFVTTLREKFGYPNDHLIILAEDEDGGVGKANRENVQRALRDLRKRLTRDDQLLVFLMGHGSSADADAAKFNLVGPDLTADEWADLVKSIPGRLVFVDSTAGSAPFLQKIAGRGRVVLTATDTAAQQFETVFPEYFVKAFENSAADVDKNGRVSLWEAFAYASAGVRQWFEQRGQLPTERPVLDDDGDGVGREAANPGLDGALARITYVEPDVIPSASDSALDALLKRRAALEGQVEALKARKSTMASDEYEAELEKVLTELARVSLQIRAKS